MPKLKTKKSMAKRVKFTKKGKVKRSKACRGHILTKKSRKRKRHLRQQSFVDRVDKGTVKKLLPYG